MKKILFLSLFTITVCTNNTVAQGKIKEGINNATDKVKGLFKKKSKKEDEDETAKAPAFKLYKLSETSTYEEDIMAYYKKVYDDRFTAFKNVDGLICGIMKNSKYYGTTYAGHFYISWYIENSNKSSTSNAANDYEQFFKFLKVNKYTPGDSVLTKPNIAESKSSIYNANSTLADFTYTRMGEGAILELKIYTERYDDTVKIPEKGIYNEDFTKLLSNISADAVNQYKNILNEKILLNGKINTTMWNGKNKIQLTWNAEKGNTLDEIRTIESYLKAWCIKNNLRTEYVTRLTGIGNDYKAFDNKNLEKINFAWTYLDNSNYKIKYYYSILLN